MHGYVHDMRLGGRAGDVKPGGFAEGCRRPAPLSTFLGTGRPIGPGTAKADPAA